MDWQTALAKKKEELEEARRRRSFAELRARLRDCAPRGPIPRLVPVRDASSPGALTPRIKPSPTPGSLLMVPDNLPLLEGGDSPFSLESLIAAEINAASMQKAMRAPEIPLLPELKRRALPTAEPRIDPRLPRGAVETYLHPLKSHPSAMIVWTDAAYYGGSPEDLSPLVAWCETRRDEFRPPVMVRADLFLDPYQVLETRFLGGDALLVSLDPLVRSQLEDLVGVGEEVGVRILPYVHTEHWVEALLALGFEEVVVGEGSLFDLEARETAGMGPLRALRRDLPPGAGVYSLGGLNSLKALDERAQSGSLGAFSGRGYLELLQAQRVRRERRG